MIVIPMAGESRRFREAGYTRPKYELPLQGDSLFAWCVRSFERYFASERFVFIVRAGLGAEAFVAAECERLGVGERAIVALDGPTRGQAETVLLGLRAIGCTGNEAMLVFNIDTIRPGYAFPAAAIGADGYLEVVRAPGEHWSFVLPAASFERRVAQTTEKRRVSELCCTGLYYFARTADFIDACDDALREAGAYLDRWGELYVAPLYNSLIAAGKRIVYDEAPASRVHFAGTPAEYGALLASRRSLG
ncbi:MAG: glycosyltransferase family 2 protein [Ramlibacter sp.]